MFLARVRYSYSTSLPLNSSTRGATAFRTDRALYFRFINESLEDHIVMTSTQGKITLVCPCSVFIFSKRSRRYTDDLNYFISELMEVIFGLIIVSASLTPRFITCASRRT